jgi:pimeloyl-ACP methyl ester carboxylesterase
VALEYALRYPASLSHLVLLDTGGDSCAAYRGANTRRYGRLLSPAIVPQ